MTAARTDYDNARHTRADWHARHNGRWTAAAVNVYAQLTATMQHTRRTLYEECPDSKCCDSLLWRCGDLAANLEQAERAEAAELERLAMAVAT